MPPKKNAVAARIKRLMQADDDVGKIAQATPILMAKALDLFLEELMKSTTEIATSHGAKTVSAGHLRASIMQNDKFDFLKEIVEGVPDLPTEQGNKTVVGSLSEGEEVRMGSSSLGTGRPGGEPSTAKRDRPPKPPQQAKGKAVEEDDHEPALKVMRGAAVGELDVHQGGSLDGGGSGVNISMPPVFGTAGTVVGTLAEDDDYDDL